MDVEFRLDEPPGAGREPNAKAGIGEESVDGVRKRKGIALPHHQAGVAVMEHFGNARYIRRDTRRAQRHRLEEHVRQSVSVSVLTDYTG